MTLVWGLGPQPRNGPRKSEVVHTKKHQFLLQEPIEVKGWALRNYGNIQSWGRINQVSTCNLRLKQAA